MREVNNNTGMNSAGAQRTPNFKGVDKNDMERPSNVSSQGKEIKREDLKNTPAEIIGRSQVQQKADNLDNDINLLVKNPKLVEKTNDLMEALNAEYKKQGLSDEAAAKMSLTAGRNLMESIAQGK